MARIVVGFSTLTWVTYGAAEGDGHVRVTGREVAAGDRHRGAACGRALVRVDAVGADDRRALEGELLGRRGGAAGGGHADHGRPVGEGRGRHRRLGVADGMEGRCPPWTGCSPHVPSKTDARVKVTLLIPVSPDPVMVTTVPPVSGPKAGFNPLTPIVRRRRVGEGLGVRRASDVP